MGRGGYRPLRCRPNWRFSVRIWKALADKATDAPTILRMAAGQRLKACGPLRVIREGSISPALRTNIVSYSSRPSLLALFSRNRFPALDEADLVGGMMGGAWLKH